MCILVTHGDSFFFVYLFSFSFFSLSQRFVTADVKFCFIGLLSVSLNISVLALCNYRAI